MSEKKTTKHKKPRPTSPKIRMSAGNSTNNSTNNSTTNSTNNSTNNSTTNSRNTSRNNSTTNSTNNSTNTSPNSSTQELPTLPSAGESPILAPLKPTLIGKFNLVKSPPSDDVRRGVSLPVDVMNSARGQPNMYSPPIAKLRPRANSDPWFHTYELDFLDNYTSITDVKSSRATPTVVLSFSESSTSPRSTNTTKKHDSGNSSLLPSSQQILSTSSPPVLQPQSLQSPPQSPPQSPSNSRTQSRKRRRSLKKTKRILSEVSDAIYSGDAAIIKKYLQGDIESAEDETPDEDFGELKFVDDEDNSKDNQKDSNSSQNPLQQSSPTSRKEQPRQMRSKNETRSASQLVPPKQQSKSARRLSDFVRNSPVPEQLAFVKPENAQQLEDQIEDTQQAKISFSSITKVLTKKLKASYDHTHVHIEDDKWLSTLQPSVTAVFTEDYKKTLINEISQKTEIPSESKSESGTGSLTASPAKTREAKQEPKSDDKSDGKLELAGSSLPAFIAIVMDSLHDENIVNSFILTFRQYISINKLLTHLINLYDSSGKLNDADQLYIRIRVVLLLKKWIHIHIADFREDGALNQINEFITQLKLGDNKAEKGWSLLLCKEWNDTATYLARLEAQPEKRPGAPRPLLSETLITKFNDKTNSDFKSYSALDFHPIELARQITIFDHKIFSEVKLAEFMKKSFSKAEESPGLHQLIARFNLITKWVGTEIATTPNIKTRIKSLLHFISIADELRKLQNYNALTAVISGLTQFPVQRLKNTWKGLSPKSLELYKDLEEFSTPVRGFYKIREACVKATPPLILPLAMLCKDLTFIEDGNPDWKDKEKQIINLKKIEILGKTLSGIRDSQQTQYQLNVVPNVQKYLQQMFVIDDEDTLITLSKKSEPPSTEL